MTLFSPPGMAHPAGDKSCGLLALAALPVHAHGRGREQAARYPGPRWLAATGREIIARRDGRSRLAAAARAALAAT